MSRAFLYSASLLLAIGPVATVRQPFSTPPTQKASQNAKKIEPKYAFEVFDAQTFNAPGTESAGAEVKPGSKLRGTNFSFSWSWKGRYSEMIYAANASNNKLVLDLDGFLDTSAGTDFTFHGIFKDDLKPYIYIPTEKPFTISVSVKMSVNAALTPSGVPHDQYSRDMGNFRVGVLGLATNGSGQKSYDNSFTITVDPRDYYHYVIFGPRYQSDGKAYVEAGTSYDGFMSLANIVDYSAGQRGYLPNGSHSLMYTPSKLDFSGGGKYNAYKGVAHAHIEIAVNASSLNKAPGLSSTFEFPKYGGKFPFCVRDEYMGRYVENRDGDGLWFSGGNVIPHTYLSLHSLGKSNLSPEQVMAICRKNIGHLFPGGTVDIDSQTRITELRLNHRYKLSDKVFEQVLTDASKFGIISHSLSEELYKTLPPQVQYVPPSDPTYFTFEALGNHILVGTALHGVFKDSCGELWMYQQGRGTTTEQFPRLAYLAAHNVGMWEQLANNLKSAIGN